ncbi:hypothetical protein BWI17_13610 [Betaproteobacteria bacterium GR16-43]|nr:hypothetical protein BWI17_13610 [Betaproteobacteria bacterium GR16-43]
MKRRDFLQLLGTAPLAATAPAFGAAPGANANRLLVLVYLYGGNDGYNSWVPYGTPLYYKLRPTIAIPRDAVLKVTEHHGFHPSLAPLAPLLASKEMALVQGIGLEDITQQHFRDAERAFTAADTDQYLNDGWVTRALQRRTPDEQAFADAVALGLLDIRESDPMGPMRGDRQRVVQVHYAHELLAKRRIADCVIGTNTRGAAAVKANAGALRMLELKTAFPADPFGQSARAAVELAASDRAIPVIHLALNGLDDDKHHSVDCHWEQAKYHGDALKRLAEGLAALRAGLIEIGRWDETLVATYDEFGRAPVENEDKGTHHGHGTTHFVLGGRVKGGLLGEAPAVIKVHNIGGPPPVIDTRSLWTTVIEQWWGASADGVFARRYRPLDLLRA